MTALALGVFVLLFIALFVYLVVLDAVAESLEAENDHLRAENTHLRAENVRLYDEGLQHGLLAGGFRLLDAEQRNRACVDLNQKISEENWWKTRADAFKEAVSAFEQLGSESRKDRS